MATSVIMDEFLVRALLGGILVALISAPLGCLVVWQRMSYFGATLSHAALLGIALGLAFELDLRLSILLVSLLIVLLLMLIQRFRTLSSDTVLGILAHSSLAFGMLALSMMPSLRVDLMGYLFGDILTVSWQDIGWILSGSALVVLILIKIWRPLLSIIIHADLAWVDGYNRDRFQLIFLLLISLTVAVSMQVVGLLLIVSLLIIPPAAARMFSSSPEQMLLGAAIVGVVSVVCGLGISVGLDTPAGPSIVACGSILFMLSLITSAVSGLKRRH